MLRVVALISKANLELCRYRFACNRTDNLMGQHNICLQCSGFLEPSLELANRSNAQKYGARIKINFIR